jgi:autophagy-related protein 27
MIPALHLRLALALVLPLLSLVSAFDISAPPFDELNLKDDMMGVYEIHSTKQSPPSTVTIDWYFALSKGLPKSGLIGHGCPDDSTLCGIVNYKTDSQGSSDGKPIQLFSLNSQAFKYENFTAISNNVIFGDLTLKATVDFKCSESATSSDLQWDNPSVFIDQDMSFSWYDKRFCAGGNSDSGNDKDKNKDSESGSTFGFFGTFLLIIVVAFAAYIVAQAWYNTSTMGNTNDFFNELTDTIVESLSTIPSMIMEVIRKLTGGGSSSRGGYSAV